MFKDNVNPAATQTSENNPTVSSQRNSRVSQSTHITDSMVLRFGKEFSNANFTLYSEMIKKGGLPVFGNTIGAIPTIAFGLTEHIGKGSSVWTATVDIGSDIGLGMLPLYIQVGMKISELADIESRNTPGYMAFFDKIHSMGDQTMDCSAEFERWHERGQIDAMAMFFRGYKAIKSSLMSDSLPGISADSVSNSVSLRNQPSIQPNMKEEKPLSKTLPSFKMNGFFTEPSLSNSNRLPTAFSMLEVPSPPKSSDQSAHVLNKKPEKQSPTTQSQPSMLSPDSNKPVNAPSINSDEHRSYGTAPKAPPPSGFGTIVPDIRLVPGGIHLGAVSKGNALNFDIGLGIRFSFDDLITEAGNRFFGTCVTEGIKEIASEKYRYELNSIKGKVTKFKLIVWHMASGMKVSEHVELKKFNLNHPKNKPILDKSFANVFGYLSNQIFQKQQQDFHNQFQNAVQKKDYDTAERLANQFYGKYNAIPGIADMAAKVKSDINMQKANDLVAKGIAHLASNDPAAMSCFLQAQNYVANHPIAAFELTKLYVDWGDWNSAIKAWNVLADKNTSNKEYLQYLQNNRDAENHVQAGRDLAATGKDTEAAQKFKLALSKIPDHTDAKEALDKLYAKYLDQGNDLVRNEKLDDAIKKYQELQKICPDHAGAAFSLAKIHADNSDFDRAIMEINRAAPSLQRDQYSARLTTNRISRRAVPFINALFQFVEQHIHHLQLHPVVNGGLRVFSAINHVHPQALVAIPYYLSGDIHAREAWYGLLQERFSYNYTSALFVANGALSAMRSLGVSHPVHRHLAEGLGYAQQMVIGNQLIKDLNITLSSPTTWNWTLAVKTSSLSMAIPLLTAPMTNFYDSYFHSEFVAETRWECFKRDMVSVGLNTVGAWLGPEALFFYNFTAGIVVPGLKYFTGLYDTEAQQGLLRNARNSLLSSKLEMQEQAQQRYAALPDIYGLELEFKTALQQSGSLTNFQFSSTGGNKDVAVGIAAELLRQTLSEDVFADRSVAFRNECLDMLQRVSEIDSAKDISSAIFARQVYTVAIYNRGYLNAAEEQLLKTSVDVGNEYVQRLEQRGLWESITDWLKEKDWLTFVLGTETSTANITDKRNKLIIQTKECKETAAEFSSGNSKHGFARYLLMHSQARKKMGVNVNDLTHEIMMLQVLSYLYGDPSSIAKLLEEPSEPIDNNKAITYLLIIRFHSADIQLKRLAAVMLKELKLSETKGYLFSQMCDMNDGQIRKTMQKNAESSETKDDLEILSNDESKHTDTPDVAAMMNCFFSLTQSNTCYDPDIEEKIKPILAKFLQTGHPSEASENSHFQYEKTPEAFPKQTLVSLYLSAMVMFVYMCKKLCLPKIRESESIENNTMTLVRLKYEILDNIILHGYLPPFFLMMKRMLQCFSITEKQSMEMLNWYQLDTKNYSGRSKLDLLLALYRNINTAGYIGRWGALCRFWGNVVRFSLFNDVRVLDGLSKKLYQKIQNASCQERAVKIAKEWLAQGADVDYQEQEETLLHIAVEKRWPDLVLLLCQYGINTDVCNRSFGITPLQRAVILFASEPVSNDLIHIVEILTEYGSNSSLAMKISFFTNPILWWNYSGKSSYEVLSQTELPNRPAELSTAPAQLPSETSPVMVTGNHLSSLIRLERIRKNTEQLLQFADYPWAFSMIKPHLDNGLVDIDKQEPVDQCQAIHKAARGGNLLLVKRLLELDSKLLVAKAGGGLQPIHYACKNNQQEIVKYLLNFAQIKNAGLCEALLLSTDDKGCAPLDYVLLQGHDKLYRYLISFYEKILDQESLKHWLGDRYKKNTYQADFARFYPAANTVCAEVKEDKESNDFLSVSGSGWEIVHSPNLQRH